MIQEASPYILNALTVQKRRKCQSPVVLANAVVLKGFVTAEFLRVDWIRIA